MKIKAKDFPKLECPFEKEFIEGNYVVIPKLREEFKWIITDKCLATTKLDGTNVSIVIEDGEIVKILNRTNKINIWKSGIQFYDGVRYAIDSGHIKLDLMPDCQLFGELIGPKLNSNPYQLKSHRFINFDYIKEKYYFKFWNDIINECEGKNDEEAFKIIENVFKGLWCLYKRQLGIKGEVNEDTKFKGLAAEGIVFYNIETGQMCKLRRDMFSWFSGSRHNDGIYDENRSKNT